MPQTLRPYQVEALQAVDRQFERGVEATIVSLFTGLGKTNCFIELVYRQQRSNPAARSFVIGPAHLTMQTHGRILSTYPQVFGGYSQVGHKKLRTLGVELADKSQPDARIVVGSVPTLIDRVPEDVGEIQARDLEETIYGGVKLKGKHRRVLVSERVDEILYYGLPLLLIYDEIHHAVGDGSLLLINRLRNIANVMKKPRPHIVGFTATAWREDGRALDNVFQTIAIHRGYEFGVKQGYLSPLATPIRIHADLGDDVTSALKVNDWKELILKGWREKAQDADNTMRPTVAYMKTVQHSEALAAYLREQGVRAAHLDGEKTIDANGNVTGVGGREAVFREVLEGKTQIICNYGVILEGIDLPPLSCIIWGRPTENAALVTQAVGRVLRRFEGNAALPAKQDALIIDVTGHDINMLSAGTLAGYKYDPLQEQYVDTEDEEMTLLDALEDGADMRDVGVKNMAQTSKGIRYSFARIIQQSGSVWYHDDRYDILSLGISDYETLLVTPPHYTFKAHLDELVAGLQAQMLDDDDALLNDYTALAEMAQILGGYTLWSVKKDVPLEGFLSTDPNLDVTLDYATIYMSNHATTAAFYNKGKRWRSAPQTDAQRRFLKQLVPGEDTSYLSCGEASQKITHILNYDRRLQKYLAKRMLAVQRYLPLEKAS